MRLLFVIKAMRLSGGGAERVVVHVASALAAKGHDVILASFDPPGAADFYLSDERVRRLRLGVGETTGSTGFRDMFLRAWRLRRAMRQHQPDAVIGFMNSAYVPLAFAGRPRGVAAIGSEHTVWEHYGDRLLERLSLKAAAHLLDSIVVVSQPVRESFPPGLRRRLVAIPNPILRPDPLQEGSAHHSGRTLLSVGRLYAEKDHATLLRAFALLAPQFPQWKLRIVGEGALRPELEDLAKGLGIEERVEMPGAVAAIGAEYARADLFVMPSTYESFGLATGEALATGVPAIGFADCPGTNEIIAHRVNGLLVEGPDRVEALASGLEELMGSERLRRTLGAAGPNSVERFSLEAVADQWEEELRRHVASARSR